MQIETIVKWLFRRGLSGAAVLCACMLAASGAIAAAKAAQPATPDWNGIWVIANSFMDKQDGTSPSAPGRFNPEAQARGAANAPAFKGHYLEIAQESQKAQAEGKPIGDNGALCLPQGMPSFWGGPYAFEIMQTAKQLNVYQEWNEQTRRIYLDGRKQPNPDDLDPSYNGHSIGQWKGDVLVVDTIGIREDTALRSGGGGGLGGRHSDAIHITERISSEGPDLLKVEETVEDEKALAKPWVNVLHLHRKSGMEISEYVCEENNRNPVGADGVTKTLLNGK